MSSEAFWLGCWGIIGGTILGLVLIGSLYYNDRDSRIIEMIKAGAPAMEASCVVDDPRGDSPTCVIIATKKEYK